MEGSKKNNYTLQGFLNYKKVFKTLKGALGFALKFSAWRFWLLVIFAIITAVLPYLQNGLFARLIDQTIAFTAGTAAIQGVIITTIILIGATALPSIINLFEGFTRIKFRFKMIRELELFFLKKISTLDIATIESAEYQELTQKAK
jgi:ABC-type multidrug transport system fused ATPase/permease subunit